MCGRFTLTADSLAMVTAAQQLAETLFAGVPHRPRYNIAPTQEHPIVRAGGEDQVAETARWGLVNSWATDAKRAGRQINARSETVATSRAYARSFKRRRCVVPADGWYEWSGPKDARQPHWIHHADREPFFFAGLYEIWHPTPEQAQTTFTILTTDANDTLAAIHQRMPVVMPVDRLDDWLDPTAQDMDALSALLVAAPNDAFISVPVSPRVNSVRNDDSSLLQPHEQPSFDRLLQ